MDHFGKLGTAGGVPEVSVSGKSRLYHRLAVGERWMAPALR